MQRRKNPPKKQQAGDERAVDPRRVTVSGVSSASASACNGGGGGRPQPCSAAEATSEHPPPPSSSRIVRHSSALRGSSGRSGTKLRPIVGGALHLLIGFALPVLGAALCIYQLWRLHELGVAGVASGGGRLGGSSGGGGGGGPSAPTGSTSTGTAATTTTTTTTAAADATTQHSTSSPPTLFPPYLFYTASNLTPTAHEQSADYRQYLSHCTSLNPTYQLRTYDNVQSRSFVVENYPHWLQLYDTLPANVMRADVFRYLVLHHYGGVYLDGDVDCRRPIDEWGEVFGIGPGDVDRAERLGALVGMEYRRPLPASKEVTKGGGVTKKGGGKARPNSNSTYYPPMVQFVQWTMAAQPNHPIFVRTVELINETMSSIRTGEISPPGGGNAVYLTGPIPFTHAILEYMVDHNRITLDQIVPGPPHNFDVLLHDPTLLSNTTTLVGTPGNNTLGILHEDAFAYRGGSANRGNVHSQAGPYDDTHYSIYVRHWFAGTWKVGGERKRSDKFGLFRSTKINSVEDVKGGGPILKGVVVSRGGGR